MGGRFASSSETLWKPTVSLQLMTRCTNVEKQKLPFPANTDGLLGDRILPPPIRPWIAKNNVRARIKNEMLAQATEP